jgi:hypothetical protein
MRKILFVLICAIGAAQVRAQDVCMVDVGCAPGEIPRVTLPEAALPLVVLPQTSLPEVTLPYAAYYWPEASASVGQEFALRRNLYQGFTYDHYGPQVRTPPINAPQQANPPQQVYVPQIQTPQIHVPQVHVPQVHVPQVHASQVYVPQIAKQ